MRKILSSINYLGRPSSLSFFRQRSYRVADRIITSSELEEKESKFFELLINRDWLDARNFLKEFEIKFPHSVNRLLEARYKIADRRHGYTPLLLCATLGNKDMVDLLLKKGVDINAQGSTLNAEGPLAAIYDRLKGRFHYNHNSALHKACAQGNTAVVLRLLEEKNLRLDLKNSDGDTCLHVLLNSMLQIQAKLFIASHLLRIEPNLIFIKNNKGLTIFDLIDKNKVAGNISLKDKLVLQPLFYQFKLKEHIRHKTEVDGEYTAIFDLLREGEIDLFKKKIKEDSNLLMCKNKKNENLLFIAIHEMRDDKQCEEVVKYLLESSILLLDNSGNLLTNDHKSTVIHLAASKRSPYILKCLIEQLQKFSYMIKRFNEIRDLEGNTILHTAAISESDETLLYLIENHKSYNLDLTAINHDDKNILHMVIEKGATLKLFNKVIDLLKKLMVKEDFCKILKERDVRGRRVLHAGAESANISIFRALCNLYKEDPSLKPILFPSHEDKEPTVMHSAIYRNRKDIVDCFSQDNPKEFIDQISRKSTHFYGARIREFKTSGRFEGTPVALAAREGHDSLLIHLYLKARYLTDNITPDDQSKILNLILSEDTLCEAINNNNLHTIILLTMTDPEIYEKIEKITQEKDKITVFNKKLFEYMRNIFAGVLEIIGPECLVFKGGGVKGLAYGGVLEGLEAISHIFRRTNSSLASENFDILSDAIEIGGSSAGAIISLAIVRMSMSFPIFFTVHQPRYIHGDQVTPCYLHEITEAPSDGDPLLSGFHHYVDGGTIHNYPLKYLFGKKIERSLGFFLTSPEELTFINRGQNPYAATPGLPVESSMSFLMRLAACVLTTEEREHFDSKMEVRQTIYMGDTGIGALDFNIKPNDVISLKTEGRLAVTNYFTNLLWTYFELRKLIKEVFSAHKIINEAEDIYLCHCLKSSNDEVIINFDGGLDKIDILTQFFNKKIDESELGNLLKVQRKETSIQFIASNTKVANLVYTVCKSALEPPTTTLTAFADTQHYCENSAVFKRKKC